MWTPEDAARYTAEAPRWSGSSCYTVVDSATHGEWQAPLGENIADFGASTVAVRGLEQALGPGHARRSTDGRRAAILSELGAGLADGRAPEYLRPWVATNTMRRRLGA